MGKDFDLAFKQAEIYLKKKGYLSLSPRVKILRSFGLENEKNAKKTRLNLALLCVEKVLPLWEKAYPKETLPHEHIQLTQKVLKGSISVDAAKKKLNDDWTYLDDMDCENYAHAVGYAALKLVRIAISDEMWLEDDKEWKSIEENDLSDEDFDPYMWSVSYRCCLAYAEEKPIKVKKFWDWYLNNAVKKV